MVKNILLIRHCQASPDSPTNRDFDRPLTTHGLNQSEMLGQHVQGLDLALEAVYLSPSVRTMQTTKGIIDQLDFKPRLMDAEELYEATDNVLKAVIQRFDKEFQNVAVVGHNPSVALLFHYLTADFRDYSPGTAAWISFEVDDWSAIGKDSGVIKDFYQA